METLTAIALPRAEIASLPMIAPHPAKEDPPSFREVFDAEESPLLRFAFGLVGRREVAEDLVQESFLRLHSHWDEVTNPRAWLFRAVRNLALNHHRDHRRESPLDDQRDWESAAPDPEGSVSKLETIGTLQLLMAELKEEDRKLIRLKYHEGLKYEQISERTGMTVGNIGYKLHHLLKGLADSLRRMGVESAEG